VIFILRIGPRKRIDRPTRNKITAILLSILWGISGLTTWILDYKDIIDVTEVIRLPIGFVILIFIVLGFFAVYTLYSIYKLIKEIRYDARTKNIETAEEVFQKKYGDEFEINNEEEYNLEDNEISEDFEDNDLEVDNNDQIYD